MTSFYIDILISKLLISLYGYRYINSSSSYVAIYYSDIINRKVVQRLCKSTKTTRVVDPNSFDAPWFVIIERDDQNARRPLVVSREFWWINPKNWFFSGILLWPTTHLMASPRWDISWNGWMKLMEVHQQNGTVRSKHTSHDSCGTAGVDRVRKPWQSWLISNPCFP